MLYFFSLPNQNGLLWFLWFRIVFLNLPSALSDWWLTIKPELLHSHGLPCITMVDCWILPKHLALCVAPRFSEQPRLWCLWSSPPSSTKSMMQFILPGTPLLISSIVYSLGVPCHVIPQYWNKSVLNYHIAIMMLLLILFFSLCQGPYKDPYCKNASISTCSLPLNGWFKSNNVREGHCPS